MRAEVVTLAEAFGPGRRYVAPFFQRPYRWRRVANWEPFWAHWSRSADFGRANFLGAIVLETADGRDGPDAVLDGQQRLLTALAAAAALESVFRAFGAVDAADGLARLIRRPDGAPTVVPTPASARDLEAALTGAPPPADGDGTLAGARGFFDERLYAALEAEPSPEAAAERYRIALTERAKIVLIASGADVGAFDLFERLNNLGEPLSALDLVKTQLFERAGRAGRSRDALEGLHRAHWGVFDAPDRVAFWGAPERRGSELRPRQDWFLRAYLSVRLRRAVSAGEVLDRMADLAEGRANTWSHGVIEDGAAQEIASLGAAAEAFLEIAGAAEAAVGADRIAALRRFARMAAEPALMAARMHLWDDPTAREAALSMLESCAVRRFAVGLAAGRDTDVYARLAREIAPNAPGAPPPPPGRMAERLRAAVDGRFWPDNAALAQAFRERPFADDAGGPQAEARRGRIKAMLAALDDHAAGRVRRAPSDRELDGLALVRLTPPPPEGDPVAYARIGNLALAPADAAARLVGLPWPKRRAALAEGGGWLNERLNFDARYRQSFGPSEIEARGAQLAELALARWPRPR